LKLSKAKSPAISWSPQLKELRALSLKQPWAWLIVNGYKDIENRSWRTNHRGPLLIHASSSRPAVTTEYIQKKYGVRLPDKLEFGGIAGVVEVVDCVKQHPSKYKERGSWDGF
jgi:hypothetical protein